MSDPLGEESSAQLVEFDSQPSSPKTDLFNFYQAFSPTLDEDNVLTASSSIAAKKLDKHSSRHLLYASYFPVSPNKLSKQERVVILCGTGRTRLEVEAVIDEIISKAKTIFLELAIENSLDLPPSTVDFMKQFKMLPNFNQNEIASICVDQMLENLASYDSNSASKDGFPSCSQLVFVCELLEITGSFRKLIDLLVELVSYSGEKKEEKRQAVRLPLVLCLPIVNLFWHYFPILLLSISDMALVYER